MALRATWAALLLRLRLRSLAEVAYDEALVTAAALAEEFAPTPEPVNLWSVPLVTTQATATTTTGQYFTPWKVG